MPVRDLATLGRRRRQNGVSESGRGRIVETATRLLEAIGKSALGLTEGMFRINAGPGAASGKICFHASDAEQAWLKDNKVKLILVRRETSPEDLRGMKIAQGRAINDGDTESSPLVAVVNESMARQYFPQGRPLGRTIEIPTNWRSPFAASKGKPIEIVSAMQAGLSCPSISMVT